MTRHPDIDVFEEVLKDLNKDIERYPFHYGNEHPIAPELYGRLRSALDPPTTPLEYKQEHSDLTQWRNRDMFDRLSPDQEVPRVQPEVEFYHEGGRWRGSKRDYDLAIFKPDAPLIMQGKREGIGNFIDTETEISVLCEIKHSLNMSGRFRDGGAADIRALSEFPGEVNRSYFVFLDWWPKDGYEKPTFEADIDRLRDSVADLGAEVDVAYLPRAGEVRFARSIG